MSSDILRWITRPNSKWAMVEVWWREHLFASIRARTLFYISSYKTLQAIKNIEEQEIKESLSHCKWFELRGIKVSRYQLWSKALVCRWSQWGSSFYILLTVTEYFGFFTRLTANLYSLRLTEILKINYGYLKKLLKFNSHCLRWSKIYFDYCKTSVKVLAPFRAPKRYDYKNCRLI